MIDETTEELETQNTQDETEEVTGPTEEQIAQWKHDSEVGAQTLARAKKAEEEARLLKEQLENTLPIEESDPISERFNEYDRRFKKIEEEKDIALLQIEYPAIKDKLSEFEEYKAQYPQVPIKNVAKLFLAEHDLLVTAPKRKGLEKGGGGTRTVPTSDMSGDEARQLRTSNFKEYSKQIREGKLKINT